MSPCALRGVARVAVSDSLTVHMYIAACSLANTPLIGHTSDSGTLG